MEDTRLFHFDAIRRHVENLSTRWWSFRQRSDLDETMKPFVEGVKDTQATAHSRFELACHWVDAARTSEHGSLPIAYEHAMSLMQSSLVFAPTLPTQHNRLVEKRDLYEKTPLDFASYQIHVAMRGTRPGCGSCSTSPSCRMTTLVEKRMLISMI
jgi:hypothetical protein